MFRYVSGLATAILLAAGAAAQTISPAARSDLAPTGKLRIGVHYANVFLVTRDPESGELRGVAVDIARELGRRVGVPVEFIAYANATRLTRAAASGEWDVSFQAAEASRAGEITFTAAFAEIEATYLVPPGSSVRKIEDVDRSGVRVAVPGKSALDQILTRTLKNAQLVRAQGFDGAVHTFVSESLDALAGLRPRLIIDAESLPGSRVLEDRFAALSQAIGTPREREEAARYLREFVEDAKASGLITKAIEKAGIRGMSVAPLVSAR